MWVKIHRNLLHCCPFPLPIHPSVSWCQHPPYPPCLASGWWLTFIAGCIILWLSFLLLPGRFKYRNNQSVSTHRFCHSSTWRDHRQLMVSIGRTLALARGCLQGLVEVAITSCRGAKMPIHLKHVLKHQSTWLVYQNVKCSCWTASQLLGCF